MLKKLSTNVHQNPQHLIIHVSKDMENFLPLIFCDNKTSHLAPQSIVRWMVTLESKASYQTIDIKNSLASKIPNFVITRLVN